MTRHTCFGRVIWPSSDCQTNA